MSDGHNHATTFEGLSDDYRRRLLLVTAINIVMFVVEMTAGQVSGSQALKADALDFFADGATYALSFWAIGKPDGVRAGAAMLKGISLLLMGSGSRARRFGRSSCLAFLKQASWASSASSRSLRILPASSC